MSNEANTAEAQAVPAVPDAATTPIDLAQAFSMLNKADRETAQEPMVEESGSEIMGEQGATGRGEETFGAGSSENASGSADTSGEQDGGGDVGGSANSIEAIDFNAYKQEMLRDIQRSAQAQVRREFDEQNIGYYSAAELTVRDEQTGQVRFRNPDVQDERDPNYYFKSRTEMQNFIDAWNRGVDFEYRKAVNEKQRTLLVQETPKAQLIDFIPKFQAMDAPTQQVFDALLEGHEVRNANGKVIGFNVNLDAVAAQASRLVKSFGGVAQPAPQGADGNKVPASGGPALDAKTGNGKSEDEAEPKNIGEALKMFDKKNKGGK